MQQIWYSNYMICVFSVFTVVYNLGLRNFSCLGWLGTLLNVVIPRSNQDGEESSGVGKVFELVYSPFSCLFLGSEYMHLSIESGCVIC